MKIHSYLGKTVATEDLKTIITLMSQIHVSCNSIKLVIKMNYDLLARRFMLKNLILWKRR